MDPGWPSTGACAGGRNSADVATTAGATCMLAARLRVERARSWASRDGSHVGGIVLDDPPNMDEAARTEPAAREGSAGRRVEDSHGPSLPRFPNLGNVAAASGDLTESAPPPPPPLPPVLSHGVPVWGTGGYGNAGGNADEGAGGLLAGEDDKAGPSCMGGTGAGPCAPLGSFGLLGGDASRVLAVFSLKCEAEETSRTGSAPNRDWATWADAGWACRIWDRGVCVCVEGEAGVTSSGMPMPFSKAEALAAAEGGREGSFAGDK